MTDSPNSSDTNQTLVAPNGEPALTLSVSTLREQLWPVLASVLLLTLVTGGIFPLALFVLARPMFPTQAKGSLVTRDGVIIGSDLIGQNFTSPAYFHPRPSAAGAGYDASSSGGTNLGPANPTLKDGATDDPKTANVDESFAGIRQLTEEFRKQNGLAPDVAVPIDAVTRSGSGLVSERGRAGGQELGKPCAHLVLNQKMRAAVKARQEPRGYRPAPNMILWLIEM